MDPWEFRPPVLVGERVVWLGSGSGIPQGGVVKWIGKMPEMGPDWTVGMELDTPLPYGGIDGTWGSRHLFSCKPKHGLIVPITTTLRESDLFQKARQTGSGSQHGRPAERPAPSDQPKPAERARKPQLDARKKANAASQVSAPPRRKLEPQKSQDLIEKQKLQELKRLQELQKLKELQELEQQRRLQDLQKVKELQELQKLRELQEETRIQQQILLELEKRSQNVVLPEIFADPLLTSVANNAGDIGESEDEPGTENGEPVNPRPAIRRRKQPFPQRPTRLKCSKLTINRKASDEVLSYQCHTLDECHQPKSDFSPRVDFPTFPCGLLNRSRCETIEEECQQSSESTPKRVDSPPPPPPPPRQSATPPPPPSVRSDLSRCDTLRSIASGDYQWYDAFDKVLSESNCDQCAELDCASDHLEADSCDLGNSDESTSHEFANGDIMNSVNHVDSSYEETVAVTKQLYSEAFKGDSLLRSSTSNHSQTGSGSRKEKVNSGFFSFLRWFQKKKEDGGSCDDDGASEDGVITPSRTAPSSPRLQARSHNGSSGSVNSVFSTATVSSFSFVSPTCYRPFGDANQPEKCIAVGQDTDTYRNRLKYRDRARELDRNLTLKKKYRLYASDSVSTINTPNASPVLKIKRNESVPTSPVIAKAILAPLPGSQNSSFGRNKRRAPAPPNLPKAQYSDYSLPSTLENKSKATNSNLVNGGSSSLNKTHHRRTASESSKDKKAGAYCHVKGKRRAPAPPATGSGLVTPVNGTLEKQRTLSFGRKKRPAPLPPSASSRDEVPKRKVNKECQVEQLDTSGNKTTLSNLSPADRDKLMSNIAKLQAHANRRSVGSPPASPHLEFRASHHDKPVCNDMLKLERGVLKSNKEMPKVEAAAAEVKVAPCSPRPWYKRSLSKSDSGSSIGGGLFKSLEKKKDRDKEKEEEWMPEVGIARSSVISVSSESSSSSRFNIFSKLDWGDDKKKDGSEKRKSQVSMLANISELDREAAAIVQKEHARENAILEAQDAKFYSFPADVPDHAGPRVDDADDVDDPPKRSSARELISLFNAIGNVTRVTVNTSFFSKDGIFTKEGMEKRFSFIGENSKVEEETVITPAIGVPPTVSSPGAVKKVPPSSRVVIEEVEDELDKASRARALYEANKSRRHRSPSPNFPTIEERSETASSKATTPLSTIVQPKVAVEDARNVEGGANVWVCPRCTLENPQWKITCDVCSCWRPSANGGDTFGDREDPVERPASPLPFIDQEREIDARPVIETVKKPVLDWEMELKRYFPDSPKIARAIEKVKTDMKPRTDENRPKGETFKTEFSQSVNAAPVSANTGIQKGNHVAKSLEVDNPKNTSSQVSKHVAIANPPNFIGGRNKADESKTKVEAQPNVKEKIGNGIVGSDLPAIEESDVDELRKARLAFFHRPADRNGDLEVDGIRTSEDFDARSRPAIDETERSKLREMLKEMKNSLPKRPKNNGPKSPFPEAENKITTAENSDLYKQIETSAVHSYKRNGIKKTDDANKHGAIKKVPPSLKESEKENVAKMNATENGTVAALFITKTTVYENIKVKKVDLSKPVKVSTSVQTSAVVRKIEPTGIRPPTGLPPSHPNLPSAGQDAGAMYKSLNKDARRIGTFELIRARDFKSIEATKTRNEIIATHVYANMPDESPPTSRHPKDVLPQQPSAPAYEETLPKTVPLAKAAGPSEMQPREDFEPPQSPLSLVESSDQWSSATGSPVPQSPDSRRGGGGGRGSKASSVASEASSYSASSFRSGDNSEVERLTAQLTMPKGLADFKANLQTAPAEGNNMNTLAVNRLLRRLEAAIAGGQHAQAAGLARDLARQKISCSVTRQRRSLDSSPTAITVDMYVEDKVSHQGPIPLQVTPTMTVAQLKQKVEKELEIPINVQRWILGKLLASDDSKTLADHNVNATGCPMFLYLVAPDGELEADNASASGSTVETPPVEDEDEEGPMQFPAPPGKGWYYNYEEDHYSLCEDSDDDLSEEEVRVLSNRAPIKETPVSTNVAAEEETDDEFEEVDDGDEEEDDDEEEEEMIVRDVAANAVVAKLPVLVVDQRPATAVAPEIPRLPEAYGAVAGGSRGGLVAPPLEEATGTLRLGWQCPVCTLVNAPTRPGCAACTTERPENYVVPTAYRANKEEGLRLEREQQLEEATAEEKKQEEAAQHQHYLQLVDLDKTDLVPNMEAFDCSVCLATYGPNEGTVLRECLHTFCRPCLVNTVLFNQEAEVKCPYRDANYACDSVLQEREIKALVPKQVYEQHLAKSVAQAENKIGNAFHCKTPDCRGWCIFEDNLNEFHCPVCVKTNCLTCQAIHVGINCKQYQEKVKQESETNIEAKRTKDMLEDMVYRGEAMKCPTCQVILMKKWGCDWLRCSMCKTEICWVTRGPRWGPGGKGDTTAGCQCGLNGFKCHPRCNYCH